MQGWPRRGRGGGLPWRTVKIWIGSWSRSLRRRARFSSRLRASLPLIVYTAPLIVYAAPLIVYTAPLIVYTAPLIVYTAPLIVYTVPLIVYEAPLADGKDLDRKLEPLTEEEGMLLHQVASLSTAERERVISLLERLR